MCAPSELGECSSVVMFVVGFPAHLVVYFLGVRGEVRLGWPGALVHGSLSNFSVDVLVHLLRLAFFMVGPAGGKIIF